MVGKQAQAFLLGEADAMYERMAGMPERQPDPVLQAMDHINLRPEQVVEIGCGSGWRLEKIAEYYGVDCIGIEPSQKAIGTVEPWHARGKGRVKLVRGTASAPYPPCDLIIFGFCLYLVDREDLFDVVARADHALEDGGHIIIFDFYPGRYPSAVSYKHHEGINSYRMDYSKLWLAHPWYRLILANYGYYEDTGSCVTIIKKDMKDAFPCV